jgi:predicted dehydrogenase/threonine dehydrogenase-like Zn-dependent dehydrogenase
MKQVVQNYRSGELALLEVPSPRCRAGGVLVRTQYSLISTGTEMMKVGEARMSLLAKARARPDQVAKVVQSVATQGVGATYRKVSTKLDSWTPLGYSLAGVVEEVGEGVDDVAVGDLVACAGNEHALHGELNWVPRNLYCAVPAGVPAEHAAFGTVGAIAMQGVRRGEPQLGDVALVIGLGLIGQLVVQLLVAAGARVVGVDPDPERCALAESLGALVCADPGSGVVDTAVAEITGGHGVDQVYLAAGGSSNQPVELAAALSRDRGRVVDIGKCRLDLPWNAYYEKELDVRFSRSYGPGRYDPSYELEGRDYPIGYVRWTERRNLECVLDLVARGRLDVAPLVSHVAEFDDAVATYSALNAGELKAVAVLFRYPPVPTSLPGAPAAPVAAPVRAVPAGRPARPVTGRPVRLAFVGAGNYASSMLLPHLAGRDDVELAHVVTTSALSGANAVRRFGFGAAGTDLDAVLDDPSVDAVFVVTRHSSHAALTAQALRAGKAVFVEKPLALDGAGLDTVLDAVAESGNDRLQVGFNRRFAPLLGQARERFGRRIGPATVRYLVNAGRLEGQSWYLRSGEGTRFVGEGGHFVDTVGWLLGADPSTVYACATPGQADVSVSLGYPDGSTAVITYATTGATGFPKETLDLLADGKVLHLDDFARAAVHGRTRWASPRIPRGRDKGQQAQLAAFLAAVRTGGPMPVALDSLVATTRATLAVATSLGAGAPVRLDEPLADLRVPVLSGSAPDGSARNGSPR